MDKQRERTWWDRNWKWFLPVGCLSGFALLLGFVAAILVFVFSLMKSSDAYKLAFAKVQNSPAVASTLGEPIQGGLFIRGNINVNGSSGIANLTIPISGPKGDGTIYLKATKSMGEWTFDELAVKIEGTDQKIDLLEETRE